VASLHCAWTSKLVNFSDMFSGVTYYVHVHAPVTGYKHSYVAIGPA